MIALEFSLFRFFGLSNGVCSLQVQEMRARGGSGGRKVSITRSPNNLERELREVREELQRKTEEHGAMVNYYKLYAEHMFVQAQHFEKVSTAHFSDLQSLQAQHKARSSMWLFLPCESDAE